MWTCPKCGYQFINRNQSHSCGNYTVADFLKDKPDKTIDLTIASAKAIGKTIAERAKAKGVTKVVFDRGGYIYHGRVKAVADAAREAGLKF